MSKKSSRLPNAVIRAYRDGGSIIPCGANKAAMVRWMEFQTKRPSLSQLRKWNAELAPPAWAIITGRVSRLVVADFDGEQGLETMKKLGLRPHVRSGSGGAHVYFLCGDEEIRGKTKNLSFPGMDLKGEGGYVVFHGRNHNGEYRRIGKHAPYLLSELPEELLGYLTGRGNGKGSLGDSLLSRAGEKAAGGGNGRGDLARAIAMKYMLQACVGKRNKCGFDAALQLRDHGFHKDEATEILVRDYLPHVPQEDGAGQSRPYTLAELRKTIESAFTGEPREQWGRERDETANEPDLYTWDNAPCEDESPPWILPSVLLAMGLHVLAGSPKEGKSTLALQLALAVVGIDTKLLPEKSPTRELQGAGVLFLSLEDYPTGLLQQRQLLIGDTVSPERVKRITVGHSWPRIDQRGIEQMDEYLGKHTECRLVIIDPFVEVMPMQKDGGNAYLGDNVTMSGLRAVAHKHKVCILLIHHTTKSKLATSFLHRMQGTMAIPGGAESVLYLQRRGDVQATLKVRGRRVKPQSLDLHWQEPIGWTILGEAKGGQYPGRSGARFRTLELLKKDGPLTCAAISCKLKLHSRSTSNLLRDLCKDGVLKIAGKEGRENCYEIASQSGM
ncbi:MAG: AAA family ATPase [Acidobacteriota bacterium]